MKSKNIGKNILGKIPQVLLIIVVLCGLGLYHNSLFGNVIKAAEKGSDLLEIETIAAKVYNGNVQLKGDDGIQYEIIDPSDEVIGYAVSSASLCDDCEGYGGKTPVVIFMDASRKIVGVEMLENNETRSFAARLQKGGFFESWNGQNIDTGVQNPDAVSGVTFTSTSVIENIDAAVRYAGANKPAKKETATDWSNVLSQVAILAVVGLSLLCFFMPAKTRRLRIPMLILSIGVLGIWQGAFVSIDTIYKWVINGIPFAARFGFVLIVMLAFLLPLVLSKSWYCTYLCPFGAMQELVGKLNPRKIAVPKKVFTIFTWIRRIALIIIIALLYFIAIFEPSDVEPFTVFMIKSASLSVIIIASVSLISSIFIQRAWCRLLCPTGELLSMFQKKVTIKKNKP